MGLVLKDQPEGPFQKNKLYLDYISVNILVVKFYIRFTKFTIGINLVKDT